MHRAHIRAARGRGATSIEAPSAPATAWTRGLADVTLHCPSHELPLGQHFPLKFSYYFFFFKGKFSAVALHSSRPMASYGAIPAVARPERRAAPMLALMGLAVVAVVAVVTLSTQSRAVEMVAFPQDDLGILREMVRNPRGVGGVGVRVRVRAGGAWAATGSMVCAAHAARRPACPAAAAADVPATVPAGCARVGWRCDAASWKAGRPRCSACT